MEGTYTINASQIGAMESKLTVPTVAPIAKMVDETMKILKELTVCMNDASIALVGAPPKPCEEKLPEPDCLYNSVCIVKRQAEIALQTFSELRGRLV